MLKPGFKSESRLALLICVVELFTTGRWSRYGGPYNTRLRIRSVHRLRQEKITGESSNVKVQSGFVQGVVASLAYCKKKTVKNQRDFLGEASRTKSIK